MNLKVKKIYEEDDDLPVVDINNEENIDWMRKVSEARREREAEEKPKEKKDQE